MNNPRVSIIVPTYNSSSTIRDCLDSIKKQTYDNVELIIVDNNSKDNTKDIAKEFTDRVFNQGPERSAQRNLGVKEASGEYVLIIDSDMNLSPQVVEQCVNEFQKDASIKGLVIPEESFGEGFWAQCKKLERSFYVGVPWMEAARAFSRVTYLSLGGYDESMVSGEDWDLSQRVEKEGRLGRINAYISHNEGKLSLIKTLKKKYYYAKKFKDYTSKNKETSNVGNQTGVISRYKLFFSKPGKLFRNPITGIGMLTMKTLEFGFGAFGLIT
jgi:glycosyltransferase involved in cell wall biosynthesis